VNILSKFYYRYKKILKTIRLYLIIAGPGIIVMVADNDAGGITTYTATGAQYGFHLIWFLILLGPVAYYVQEMTVRLGAVTKRGHAEAIFHSFGAFWGWFSLLDLVLVDWLTAGGAPLTTRVLDYLQQKVSDPRIKNTRTCQRGPRERFPKVADSFSGSVRENYLVNDRAMFAALRRKAISVSA
jgi:Natural resistance-associated macrophage protein